ncbi:hypothetical protein BLNAU_19385 [Blattamonas nauphoetae]|uniref:Protein kinase domain-containing protein n=1 Tax=Blattamonas nauphoetae TaxID=2049346 RepID=A0ABQ9X5W6_9EUKA|nr:hypothetical protein BLNAU_19385 [Blattamonas nauphoetae]
MNSTNHLYGTACLDMNAGSSILCSNSSFASCSDSTTSYQHFSVATNINEITGKATFLYCTVKDIEGAFRGAINQQTTSTASATLDISWCSFQSCVVNSGGWYGVVRQSGSNSNKFLMKNSVIKNTYVEHGGGVCLDTSSSQTISQCVFSDCSGFQHSAAIFSYKWDASKTGSLFSNILFQNCAQLKAPTPYGGGAILFHWSTSINLEYLQFRNCSSAANCGTDILIDNAASGGTRRMYQLESTSTGKHVYYSSVSPLPSPQQLPSPSTSFSLVSISGKATDQWTVELTMKVSTAITGKLLALADNSASDRTEPSGYAPNIARFLPFVFSGSSEGTSSVPIGEDSYVQLHLDQYLVTTAALTSHLVTIPDGMCLPAIPTLMSASCALDQNEQNAMITLQQRSASIGVHTVVLNTSPAITFEVEITTDMNGVSEPTPVSIAGVGKKLNPDTTYEIKSVKRKSDGLIVLFHPASIKFTVPKRSCLTTLSHTPSYSNMDKIMTLSLSGYNLAETHTISFSANGSSDATFVGSVVFGSDGKGTMSGILFDADSSKIKLHYNTRYDVIGVTKNGFEVDFEPGLGLTTMKEPMRLMGVGDAVDKNDKNSTTISLTGHAALEGSYELDLENSEDSTEKVTIDASFTATDAGEAQATLYPTRQLKYGATYKVTGLRGTMSSPPTIHVETGLSITIDSEPSRLTFMGTASPQNKQKEVSMALTGIKMTNGPFRIVLNGSKTITASFAADGVTGSSTAILFSTTASEVEVEYDQTYTVVGVTDKDDNEVFFHSGLSFTTPSEQTRLVSFSIVEYDSLKKNVLVTMDGRQLDISSKYEVDLSRASSCEFTVLMEWNASSLRWEGWASLYPTIGADLVFGENYSIVEFRKQSISTPLLFEPNSIEIIPEPSRLISIDVHLNDILSATTLTLNSSQLVSGTVYQLTFSETPYSSSNTAMNSEVQIDVTATDTGLMTIELCLYPSSIAVLKYCHSYSVVSMATKAKSIPILIEKTDCVFDTPIEPTRIESGSATLNSRRDTATIVVTGRELKVGTYSIVIESGEKSFSTTVTTTTKGELSFTAPTESSSDPSKVLFGLVYSFKTVKLNGTDVFVNLNASVEIPVPPKISGISVVPNTIRTGLWIRVAGSDLPVGETFILTVVSGDSIFSFPITFPTSTTGSSEIQRMGWTDSLHFSTTYTLTSFTKLGDENDQIVNLSILTFDTPAKPVNLILYSESKSTDTSAFCGEITQPCSSMDDAWRVVMGIGFTRVAVEIVDASSVSSPMRVHGGMIVSVKNGGMKEPSLNVGDFTPTAAQPGLITVIDSTLELKDVDVVLSSTNPLSVFIHSTSSTVVMKEGSFTSKSEGSTLEGGLCEWETGVIQLIDTETIVKSTVFSHLHQGAVNMKSGNFTLHSSSFESNTPHSSSFPSVRRNIRCSEGGEIEIGSLSAGDGTKDHPSAWISHENCLLSGDDVNITSPFFIPSLNTSSSKATFDKKSSTHTFDLIGSTFIPCGLFLEVFEYSKQNDKNGEYTRELTESSTLSFTETAITLSIPQKEITAHVTVDSEWHVRLIFGDGSRTESFRVKMSGLEERKALTKQAMKWVIPVICASVALLLFFLILIVLLRRRSQKKKKENSLLNKKEELDALPPEKIEDFDNLAFPPSSIVSLTDTNGAFGVNHADTSETKLIDPPLLGGGQFEMNVEGVRADVGVNIVKIDRRDTLYNRLHMNGKTLIDKKTLAQALARSLTRLNEMNTEVTLLGRLSTHFVLFGPNNEIHLDLKEARDVNEIDVVNGQRMVPATVALNRERIEEEEDNTQKLTQPTTQPSQQGEGFELLRWRAPEAAAKTCEPTPTIDYAKAAVFSLGLILFEIETETMPFGDMDAMNAFRQLKSGILPRMDVVQDGNLRELIVSCLNLDPTQRPNLDGIEKQLESTEFSAHSDQIGGIIF